MSIFGGLSSIVSPTYHIPKYACIYPCDAQIPATVTHAIMQGRHSPSSNWRLFVNSHQAPHLDHHRHCLNQTVTTSVTVKLSNPASGPPSNDQENCSGSDSESPSARTTILQDNLLSVLSVGQDNTRYSQK